MKVEKRKYKNGKETWGFWLTEKETGSKILRRCGFETKKMAQNMGFELLQQIKLQNRCIKIDIQKTLFKEIFKTFMYQAELTYSTGTISNYCGVFKNHLQEFHNKKISEITPFFCDLWIKNKLNSGVSVYVINNCIKLVNAVFGYCVKQKLITSSVYTPMTKLKEEKRCRNRIPKTLLKDVIIMCKRSLPEFFPVFLLAIFTGMREGEYLGISVEDINFVNGSISVKKQFTRRELKNRLKTESSKRTVNVPLFLLDILKQHIEKNNIKTGLIFKAIKPHPKTLARNNYAEIPVSQNWVRDQFKKLLVLCSKDEDFMRVHDLRGEFVDLMRTSGLSIKYIAEQVGHARTSTTENIYSEILEDEVTQAKTVLQTQFADII